ncbi:ribosome quality control complex subunit 1 [[Candida] railenensis]|uniref:Ribosome quality control complex subunit 1 n=1 Tax=[Candida] railenensis TaxID=45579 RepID=A0A9P0QVG5_9ASCO|nr:ribosome quality control complex subunit 1 [[Candida] railenensis]
MSSRAVRRLQRQKLTEFDGRPTKGTAENSEDEELVESNDEQPPQKSFNAFAFLQEDEDDVEGDSDSATAQEAESITHIAEPVNIPTTAKAKNKKKNKKNKKNGKTQDDLDDDDLDKFLEEVKKKDQQKSSFKSKTPELFLDEDDLDDEDDYVLYEAAYEEEDNVEYCDSNFKYFTSNKLKKSLPLLSIGSIKNLDADNEFSSLFGKLSMETIEDANTTTSLATSPEILQQFKRLARLTRGWSGKDRRGVPGTARKLLFTRIRDDWLPTAQKPLNMDELTPIVDKVLQYLEYKEDLDSEHDVREELEYKLKAEKEMGVKYFKFNKLNSAQERIANTRFFAAVVITPDPESLMQLLQQNPYHAETLLQVAMVLLRQGSDKSTSNALIEKALFVFDRSLHKNFHELLLEGKNGLIKLPYEGFMNRQFQLCLFRYIMILGERSTYFTALNYCKLLLSFCPGDDPLGVRYFIDYYAIMSEEYKWLGKFAKSPLVTTYKKWLTPGLAYSVALAHFRLNSIDEAKKSLALAFGRHRYLACKLLETICLSSNEKLISEELSKAHSDEVLLESETYLVRAALLWKDQKEREFLNDELSKLFQESEDFNHKNKPSKLSTFFGLLPAKNIDNGSIPFNLVRFAVLSGENKIMAKVPEAIWARDDVLEYDVLPPRDERKLYDVFTGVSNSKIVDTMIDYVDQNVLGAIIQNQTGENDMDDLIQRLQAEGGEQEGEINDIAEQ